MLLTAFLLTVAFIVGYANRSGSVCVVAATRALVIDRRATRFRAFGVAAAGAATVIIPLHWLFPGITTLSAGYPVTLQVILAGAAFGLGARINDACSLGTLAHLVGGNLVYGFTIIGMVIGATAMRTANLAGDINAPPRVSPLENPSTGGAIFLGLLVAVLAVALYRRVPRWLRGLSDPGSVRMGPYRAMLILGIGGSVLYALAGSWTYMSVLSQRAARLVDTTPHSTEGWPILLCAATMIAGGVTSAWRSGGFSLRAPRFGISLRHLAGGLIMGASAAVIPGGNGTMLVHGLPSLAPHAIAAYGSMSVILYLSFLIRR